MVNAGISLLSMMLAATPVVQATPGAVGPREIPPVIWELVEISEPDATSAEIDEPARYTVQFQPNGDLAVSADCNQATGTSSAADGMLEITVNVSTLALCPTESRSEPFLALLESATEYSFDQDGLLTLAGVDGSLQLRGALSGVIWEWHAFRGGDDTLIEPEHPKDYTLTFLPDGKLAIQADCNRAKGTYSEDGPVLEIAVGGLTRAKCPPGSLADVYTRDLDEVTSHVFRDGHLYLALRADAGIMTFAARFDEPPEATPHAG